MQLYGKIGAHSYLNHSYEFLEDTETECEIDREDVSTDDEGRRIAHREKKAFKKLYEKSDNNTEKLEITDNFLRRQFQEFLNKAYRKGLLTSEVSIRDRSVTDSWLEIRSVINPNPKRRAAFFDKYRDFVSDAEDLNIQAIKSYEIYDELEKGKKDLELLYEDVLKNRGPGTDHSEIIHSSKEGEALFEKRDRRMRKRQNEVYDDNGDSRFEKRYGSYTQGIKKYHKPEDQLATLLFDFSRDGQGISASEWNETVYKRPFLVKTVDTITGAIPFFGKKFRIDKDKDGVNDKKQRRMDKEVAKTSLQETSAISIFRDVLNNYKGSEITREPIKNLAETFAIITGKDVYKDIKTQEDLFTQLDSPGGAKDLILFRETIQVMGEDFWKILTIGPKAFDHMYIDELEAVVQAPDEEDIDILYQLLGENDKAALDMASKEKVKDYTTWAEGELLKLKKIHADKLIQGNYDKNYDYPGMKRKIENLESRIASLKSDPIVQKEYQRKFALGGLMALVSANVIPAKTVQKLVQNPDPNGVDLIPEDVRKKAKVDILGVGLGSGFSVGLGDDTNKRWKDAFNVGYGLFYDKDSKSLSAGLSFGYSGSLHLGKKINQGNKFTRQDYYPARVFASVGLVAAKHLTGENDGNVGISFGAYAQVGGEFMLNGGKLNHTLNSRSAKYISASAGIGLGKTKKTDSNGNQTDKDKAKIQGLNLMLGFRQDHEAGIEITAESISNKIEGIFVDILSGLQKKNQNISIESLRAQITELLGADKNFDRTKKDMINIHAQKILGLIRVLSYHDDQGATSMLYNAKEITPAHIQSLSRSIAYNYALNRYNYNIEKLKGVKLSSLSLGIAVLFDANGVKVSQPGLIGMGFDRFRRRSTTIDDSKSLQDTYTKVEKNIGAVNVADINSINGTNGVPKKETYKSIQDYRDDKFSILSNSISNFGAEGMIIRKDGRYQIIDYSGTHANKDDLLHHAKIRIHPDMMKYVNLETSSQNNDLCDYILGFSEDLPLGVSTVYTKNIKQNIISIGFTHEEAIENYVERRGKNSFVKFPEGNKVKETPLDHEGEEYKASAYFEKEKIITQLNTLAPGFDTDFDATLTDDRYLTISKKDGSTATLGSTNQVIEGMDLMDKKLEISHTTHSSMNEWSFTILDEAGDESSDKAFNIDVKLYDALGPNKTETKIEDRNGKISFSKFENLNSGYVAMRDSSLIGNNESIVGMRKQKAFTPFSQAIDANDRNTAAIQANAMLTATKQNFQFGLDADNRKELLDLSASLIHDSHCDCDDQTSTIKNMKSMLEMRLGTSDGRNRGIYGRAKNMNLLSTNVTSFVNDRNKSLNNLGAPIDNIQKSFAIKKHNESDSMLGIVMGYRGANTTLDEKLVMNPDYIDKSKVDLDPSLQEYAMTTIMEKHEAGVGSFVDYIKNQTGMIPNTSSSEYQQFISGKSDSLTLGEGEKNTITIQAKYHFFFYPYCFNEGLGVSFTFSGKKTTTSETPGVPIENKKTGKVGFDSDKPSMLWLHGEGVAQRVQKDKSSFALGGVVNVQPENRTNPEHAEGNSNQNADHTDGHLDDGQSIPESELILDSSGENYHIQNNGEGGVVTSNPDVIITNSNGDRIYEGSMNNIPGDLANSNPELANLIAEAKSKRVTSPTNPGTPLSGLDVATHFDLEAAQQTRFVNEQNLQNNKIPDVKKTTVNILNVPTGNNGNGVSI